MLSANRDRSKAGRLRSEIGSDVVEYPPLLMSWIAFPVTVLGADPCHPAQAKRYDNAIRMSLVVADILSLACITMVLGRKTNVVVTAVGTLTYTAGGALLYALIYDRSDILVGSVIAAAIAALLLGSPAWLSLGLLAMASELKMAPLAMCPIFIIGVLPCRVLEGTTHNLIRAIAARALLFASFLCAGLIPFVASSGLDCLQFLRHQTSRGIQLESMSATVLLLMHDLGLPLQIGHSYGSTNVLVSADAAIALAVLSVGIIVEVLVVARFWKIAVGCCDSKIYKTVAQVSPTATSQYAALMLVIAVVFSKVFSPQYVLWLLGVVPMINGSDGRKNTKVQILFLLVCASTMLIYPIFFDDEVRPLRFLGQSIEFLVPTDSGILLLFVRNTLVSWLGIVLWQTPRDTLSIRHLSGHPKAANRK